jgi:excisionase family DNA binding protein
MEAAVTTPQVYTVPEVAAILKVNPQTVYRLLSAGKMRGFKVGDAWRVSQEQLEAFMRGEDGATP